MLRLLKYIACFAAAVFTVSALPAAATAPGTRIEFSSLDQGRPYKLSGTLYMPAKTSSPVPAVVMVHGTGGIDSRGELYRQPILDAGIAIFEVDFKTGIYRGPMDRPKQATLQPMAFAALKELRKLPAIDPNRIAIMGFSMGGHVTLATALESNRKMWMGDQKGFVAHAAFYPVSRPFIEELNESGVMLTGAPMIVFYGTADCYGEGAAVPELKRVLAEKYNFDLTIVEYPGATHGFNRNEPPIRYFDPAANHGRGYMEWDADAANDSVPRVVAFLRQALAVK
jgi:dienelactone hydrolase